MRWLAVLTLLLALLAPTLAFSQADDSAKIPIRSSACLDPKPDKPCVTAPRATYQPDPAYTKQARKKKLQGQVRLTVIVGTDGTPNNIKVTKSLGMGLDEEAVKTVQTGKFDPGTRDGKPVAIQITVAVDFQLP